MFRFLKASYLFVFIFSNSALAVNYLDDPSFDLGGLEWQTEKGEIKSYQLAQGGFLSIEKYFEIYPDSRNNQWGNFGTIWLRDIAVAEASPIFFKAGLSFSRKCRAYLVNFKVKDDDYFGSERTYFEKTIILQDSNSWEEYTSDSEFYPGEKPIKIEIVYAPKGCTSSKNEDRSFQIDYLQIGNDILELGGLGSGEKEASVD